MPIYDYSCDKCDSTFNLVKSIKDHQKQEPCPECGNLSKQDLSKCMVQHTGTKVEDAYKCPALGKVIKSKYDRSEQAKRAGAIEVGNDFSSSNKMHDTFDRARADRRKAVWEKD